MSETGPVVISSAVILVADLMAQEVSMAIAGRTGVQLWGLERNRLVITIESATRGEAGSLLTDIASLPGVLSANMVFECTDSDDGAQT